MLAAEMCIDGSENNLYIIFQVAGQGRRIDVEHWVCRSDSKPSLNTTVFLHGATGRPGSILAIEFAYTPCQKTVSVECFLRILYAQPFPKDVYCENSSQELMGG